MNAIELLENTKKNLCNALENHFDNTNSHSCSDISYADILYQESRSIIRAIAKEKELSIPKFVRTSRTIEEAVYDLTADIGQFDFPLNIINTVRTNFNVYIDILEEDRLDVRVIHVKSEIPDHLTFAHIKEDLKKCDKRLSDGDFSGAITSARSLVEGVCNEIIVNITGESLKDKLDLPALFTKVRNELNLNTDNPNLEKPLKQVLSGLINIVNGLAEIRNEHGDAHHRRYEVNMHHALMVINSAKTVVTFLFNTYEYQLDKGTLVKT
ncbi:hypothetical protein HNO89_003852 [Sporosarcina luteola]|nr:hypothetical protein [Sporosarcina luteola]